ncbi:MAG: bifunctional (p)ppGpp synthetase/guanosine-3',5'-bis(diphosphate) 3'-pyrophosphohydrolase [Planctomycetota bacterium]|nr:MAG: bifunctional (p)ppGpp synthetase/guanosine-3',5'-bis(diphosphate) 3'-pyrophosphohydrolase [Planctomycetota bacterium]
MHHPELERALRICLDAHAGQTRKGDGAPYAVHPLHVALILAQWGAAPEVLQAALVHDVVEDCADWSVARLEAELGARTAAIVAQLSEDKSRPWPERKQAAIDHVPQLTPEAVLVKAADKLHNLRSLAAALRESTDASAVWKRFNGGREATLRKSEELVDALCRRLEPRLARELREALTHLLRAAQVPTPAN